MLHDSILAQLAASVAKPTAIACFLVTLPDLFSLSLSLSLLQNPTSSSEGESAEARKTPNESRGECELITD